MKTITRLRSRDANARALFLGSVLLAVASPALAQTITAQAAQQPSASPLTRVGPRPPGDAAALQNFGATLTLEDALAQTGTQSQQITAAQAAVRSAEARARQAGVRLNPEVSLEVENFLGSGGFSGVNRTESTLAVGQTLELGGRRQSRQAAAQAEVDVARLRLALLQADLRQSVREQYADASAARQRIELARTALERAQDLARIATILVEAGRDPPLRALRAQSAVSEAEAELQRAIVDFATARRGLAVLFGSDQPIGDVALLTDITLPSTSTPDATRSLELRLAEAEVRAAELIIRRERAIGRPNLVTVQGGVRRFQESGDAAFVVGVSAPIPVRDQNRGSVAAAQADAEAARARRNVALTQAVRRVRDAEAALGAAELRVTTLETATIPQTAEARRLARLGYEAGRFTLLDVLDAEQSFATAQANLNDARLARARAAAALERAAAQ